MSVHTDTIIGREFDNDILTIKWQKNNNWRYRRENDWWYTYPDNQKVGDLTNDILNKEFDKL